LKQKTKKNRLELRIWSWNLNTFRAWDNNLKKYLISLIMISHSFRVWPLVFSLFLPEFIFKIEFLVELFQASISRKIFMRVNFFSYVFALNSDSRFFKSVDSNYIFSLAWRSLFTFRRLCSILCLTSLLLKNLQALLLLCYITLVSYMGFCIKT